MDRDNRIHKSLEPEEKMDWVRINTALWGGFFVALIVTIIFHQYRVSKWNNAIDPRVKSIVPFRSCKAINEDNFLRGIEYLLTLITIALFIFAVGTIPS